MKLELDGAFLRRAAVPLDFSDLRLGVSLGLIKPATSVLVACDEIRLGSEDPMLLGLAVLEGSDTRAILDMLDIADVADIDLGDENLLAGQSVRKWTYLELEAAYEIRDTLQDPFGVVEDIWANFGYPESVSRFIRYVPAPSGEPSGRIGMLDRWRRYLDSEASSLRRGASM